MNQRHGRNVRAKSFGRASLSATSLDGVTAVGSRLLRLEPLEPRMLLAGLFDVLKEINVGPPDGGGAKSITAAGAITYFVSQTAATGYELWKTDGTPAGTVLVKDILPGAASSTPKYLTNVGGTLYFAANDGVSGLEMWKSDGTAAGTVLVKDINPGAADSIGSLENLPYFTNVGGTLFFVANDGAVGFELWKSNGSAAGTALVKDVGSGDAEAPRQLTNVNGTLYFRGMGSEGAELWKSSGTAATTIVVKDIVPGQYGSGLDSLTNVNGTLYFSASDETNGTELWRSNGTSAGTTLVKDINPSGSSYPTNLINVNGTVYFAADDGESGVELWKSSGTAAGTALVKDIRLGADDGLHESFALGRATIGSTLYFFASDGTTGTELWKSGGTAATTVLVKDIRVGGTSGVGAFYGDVGRLVAVGGNVYFAADDDSASGTELWKSNGTAAGTQIVADLRHVSSFPKELANVNGMLYFQAYGQDSGVELWKSNGTAAGTVLVNNAVGGQDGSAPREFVKAGNVTYFVAEDEHGPELWKTDGTAAGTVHVIDVGSGTKAFGPQYLTNVNGTLYFVALDGDSGYELWKSTNGTSAGVTLVKDIRPGSESSSPKRLTNVNGTLYFAANDGAGGEELWKSDGTAAGTVLVKDIRPGSGHSFPRYLTAVGGTVYFSANDGSSGDELWKSNGTAAGTVLVKDIRAGFEGSAMRNLVNFNGALFFTAFDQFNGFELWKSDGTTAGTVVFDLLLNPWQSNPRQLTPVGSTLYFVASTFSGDAIWKSDGTLAGTVRVKDVNGESQNNSLANLIEFNGQIFFAANDGAAGYELWKSDGTAAGTVLVKDIRAGLPASSPKNLTNIGGTLYFTANDGATGDELWKSDGTASGTTLVADFAPGVASGSPGRPIAVGSRIVVSATSPKTGSEVWVDRPPGPGDYTRDGYVDGADFLVWQRKFGSAAAPAGSGADGNANGVIDSGDLTVWKNNVGGLAVVAAMSASAAAPATDALQAADTAFEELDAAALMGPLAYALPSSHRNSTIVREVATADRRHVDWSEIDSTTSLAARRKKLEWTPLARSTDQPTERYIEESVIESFALEFDALLAKRL
jgi:ELWxxDGT repeat protein